MIRGLQCIANKQSTSNRSIVIAVLSDVCHHRFNNSVDYFEIFLNGKKLLVVQSMK